jgi:hypothetical protein
MKYIITESKLEQAMFKYLDRDFGGLESDKGERFDVVFKSSEGDYNEFGWSEPGSLTVQRDATEKLTDFFMLDINDSLNLIGKWFQDRYNLPVDKVKLTRFLLMDKKYLIT